MHEMSLAESIVQIVENTARQHGGHSRDLRAAGDRPAGRLELDALRFCFEAASRESLAGGAALVIDQPEGQAWCMPCGGSVTVGSLADPCPACGSHQLQVTGGTELRVRDIEMA